MTTKSDGRSRLNAIPIHRRSASRFRSGAKALVILLLLSVAVPMASFGQSGIILINNLFAPSRQAGTIGDFQVILPGTGLGVDLTTDGGTYSVNTLTLEFSGTSLPTGYFDAQILALGPQGLTGPEPDLVPYGQLGNPTISPTPTLWPGVTSFINFTPTSPITLQPHTTYVIALTEAAAGSDDDALRFGTIPTGHYTFSNPGVAGGNQYVYEPFPGPPAAWQYGTGTYTPADLPILSLTATEVPEPGSWALTGVTMVLAGVGRLRAKFRFGQSNP